MTTTATTATTYQSAIEYVEALQWLGDNVTQLQEFLLPSSPLIDGGGADDTARTVQIAVLDQTNMVLYKSLGRQTKQAAVAVGDWVVRQLALNDIPRPDYDPARLEVVKAEEFERRFRPVGNVKPVVHGELVGQPITGLDGGAGWLGMVGQTTHPRALAAGSGRQASSSQQADLEGEQR